MNSNHFLLNIKFQVMKNIINKALLGIIGCAAIFTSCKKDLEEYNPSGLTSGTVYTKAAGFETLVNAAYSYSRFWYGKEEGYSVTEMGTDIWTSGTGDVFPQLVVIKIHILLNELFTTFKQSYRFVLLHYFSPFVGIHFKFT